jgi:alpha-mannosidase
MVGFENHYAIGSDKMELCVVMLNRTEWGKKIVDIADQLENAALPRLDDWQALPCERWQEPTEVPQEVKSSDKWTRVSLGEPLKSFAAWYKTTLVIPGQVAGVRVEGQISLHLETAFAIVRVFANNKYMGKIQFDKNDELVIAHDAKPGDKIEICFYADRMAADVRLDDARWRFDGARQYLDGIQDCALSLRVGSHILRADTHRRILAVSRKVGENRFPESDERLDALRKSLVEAAECFDLDALKGNDKDRYLASQEEAVLAMKPVDEFAKEWTYFLIGHSHLDLAWKWRYAEAMECGRQTIRNQIENMKKYPGYVFVESSPPLWKEIKQNDPELFSQMQEMVKKGQLEPVGATWCENDTLVISGESWARHFLYSGKFTQDNFGADYSCGFNIDAFGFSSSIPMLFHQAGVDAYVTQKLRYNDTNIFPYVLFRWRSKDGSEILGIHVVPDHYQEIFAEQMAITVNEFGAATGIKDIPVLFGIGNHGGGPYEGMFDRLERYKQLPIFPNCRFSSMGGYIKHVQENWDISKLPVVEDELYLETHRKTYTTQDQAKRGNRKLETYLTDTEKLAAMACAEGLVVPPEPLANAWDKVLLNHFHDVLPGTSIASVYHDMREDYAYAQEEGGKVRDKALHHLTSRIDTAGLPDGHPLIVFNTLAWDRDDHVQVEIDRLLLDKIAGKGEFYGDVLEEVLGGGLCVLDADGNPVACQIVQEGKAVKMLFLAENVPSMGYRTFVIARQPQNEKKRRAFECSKTRIENEKLLVELDENTGYVKSIFDKVNSREIIRDDCQANELQLFENISKEYQAWNLTYTGKEFRIPTPDSIELVEAGPVRSVIRIKRRFGSGWKKKFYSSYFSVTPACDYETSFFEQDVILYAGSDKVEFSLRADWWEENILLKTSFPLDVDAKASAAETAFSHIERPTVPQSEKDKAKYELFTLKWVDLSEGDYGIAMFNRNKHGYDVKDGALRLTLLASPFSKDENSAPDPLADKGRFSIDYALYPHAGHWKKSEMVRKSWQYDTPLIPVFAERSEGQWPGSHSWLKLDSRNVVLTCFKPSADGNGLVVRAYETAGEKEDASLSCIVEDAVAKKTDLRERPIVTDENVSLDNWHFEPYQVYTLLLEYGKSRGKE